MKKTIIKIINKKITWKIVCLVYAVSVIINQFWYMRLVFLTALIVSLAILAFDDELK